MQYAAGAAVLYKNRKTIGKVMKLAKTVNNNPIFRKYAPAKLAGNQGFIDRVVNSPAYDYISNLVGGGDYTVQRNSLIKGGGVVKGAQVPRFLNNKRSTRVQHREFLGNVISSSSANTFDNVTYLVNPGDPICFPWLSGIAAQYDQWKPHGIVFEYKTTSGSFNGTDQSLGAVILASDYDVLDAAYASKAEMDNTQFVTSSASDCNILHPIECKPSERPFGWYFVRKGQATLATGDSARFNDLCNFQIATAGVTSTSVTLGELWLTYDIEFTKEQLGNGAMGLGNLMYSLSNATSADVTASAPFGTTTGQVIKTTSTLVVTVSGTTVTFPAKLAMGSYLFVYTALGSSTAMVASTLAYTNCAAGQALFGSATGFSTGSITTVRYIHLQTIKITGVGASFTFSGGTFPTTVTSSYFDLIQLNPTVA